MSNSRFTLITHVSHMRYNFALLVIIFLVCSSRAIGQRLTREFPYAGTTYRYQVAAVQDSSVYSLHIQALKSREQGTTIYKGRIAAVFNHPRRWRITIYAAQKKKSGWTTQQDSYLETTFDLQQKTVSHFDNGALVDAAEQDLTDNFSAEWGQINSHWALAATVEYFIVNYNRALGKYDEGEELETEEALMLEQMMAERQAERDRQIAAIIEQRQQTALVADTAAKSEALAQTPVENAVVATTSASTDSVAVSEAAFAAASPPLRLEGDLSLPFVSQLPVDNKVYFIEVRYDDLNRIELKLRRYDADSNCNELIYASYIRVKDSADVSGKYHVMIHFAENNGYEWKTYPGSYLECSLDVANRQLCFKTIGSKLINRLRNPENQQAIREIPATIVNMERQEVLLAAARYFIKECPRVLVVTE